MPPLAPNALGEPLRQVSRFVASGLDVPVYRVRLEGFDTHERQRERHADLLGDLAVALATFRVRMVELGVWNTTVVATYSECRRRAAENASGGTDHGPVAPQLVLSGRVVGGLPEEAPDLAPDGLVEDDPVHTMDKLALCDSLLRGARYATDEHLAQSRDSRHCSRVPEALDRVARQPAVLHPKDDRYVASRSARECSRTGADVRWVL